VVHHAAKLLLLLYFTTELEYIESYTCNILSSIVRYCSSFFGAFVIL
jgi:hypothetical protein